MNDVKDIVTVDIQGPLSRYPDPRPIRDRIRTAIVVGDREMLEDELTQLCVFSIEPKLTDLCNAYIGQPASFLNLRKLEREARMAVEPYFPDNLAWYLFYDVRLKPAEIHLSVARYKHDCDRCTFLGQCGDADLYTCDNGNYRTFIARVGNEGRDYASSPQFVNSDMPAIREASWRWTAEGSR